MTRLEAPVTPGMAALDEVALDLPRWIRKGLVFRLVGVLALLLVVPLVIPWNETVELPLRILSSAPPRSVKVDTPGTLLRIAVRPLQHVAAGELLGQLGTASDHAAIGAVERAATSVATTNAGGATPQALLPLAIGGDVQAAYAKLASALDDLSEYRRFDPDDSDISAMRSELAENERQRAGSAENIALQEQAVALAAEKFRRREEGAKRGWVSKDSLDQARADLLDRQLALRQARDDADSRRGTIEQLRARLTGLHLRQSGSEERLRDRVDQAATDLLGAIAAWQRQHDLVSPVAGRVEFPEELHIGEYLDKASEFAVVVPEREGMIAVGTVPDDSRGLVTPGAEARIWVPSFPVSSFGYVRGQVIRTADVSSQGGYQVVVALRQGLRTSTGVTLPLRNRAVVTGSLTVGRSTIGGAIFGHLLDRISWR